MEHPTDKLLLEAEKALDRFEPEIALKFFERVFEIGSDFNIANQIANCHIQLLQLENAESWLIKSLELQPNQFYALLQLGQLKSGEQAATLFINAIHEGNQIISSSKDINIVQEMSREVSNALCALCEIYMTDLCDGAEAETNCERFMAEALRLDPKNPEVYQTMASVRISQCRVDDAIKLLETGMDIWYRPPSGEEPIIYDSNWPAYSSRLALSKLLIEVSSFERALSIIETLEVENDEDPEIWYLYSWTNLQKAKLAVDQEEGMLFLADARDCLQVLAEVL